MPFSPMKFPLAEGVGIFVGVLAWDLLSEGRIGLLKALIIAVPCTLAWYAIRRWRHRTENRAADADQPRRYTPSRKP